MEEKEKSKSKAGLRIGLLIFFLIFVLYMALWNSSRIVYRPKHFCNRAEIDANNIVATIADFYSVPENGDRTPTRSEIEDILHVDNPWTLTRCGDNFYVHVVDRSGKCPDEYQMKDPDWNSNTYTLKF